MNQQQQHGYVRNDRGQNYDDNFNKMPLFQPPLHPPRQPPPPPISGPPSQHNLIPMERNNCFTIPIRPQQPQAPSHPHDDTSNRNHNWTGSDTTHQNYNQTIFPPPLPANNFINRPPPPLLYSTTDTSQIPRGPPPPPPVVPPLKTPMSYCRPPMFVTPNASCSSFLPPNSSCSPSQNSSCPPPLTSSSCPPPPPFPSLPSLSNQGDTNYDNNKTNSLQSNVSLSRAGFAPFPPSSNLGNNTSLNVGSSPSTTVPVPQDMILTIPPPPNFNIPPPNLPLNNNNNNCTNLQQQNQQSFGSVIIDEYEKDNLIKVADLQREKDQSWINHRFLRSNYNKPCKSKATRKDSITISEGQKLLQEMLLLSAQLQQQSKTLKSVMVTASRDDWTKEVKKTEFIKKQLEHFHQKINNKDLMAELEMKIVKRRKKRERLKRMQARCYQEKEDSLTWRNELHSQINEWRDGISQKEIQIKKDKEMKKCVDSVLSEVRKKKSDVSKMLELIKTLTKLRKIRKENVAKKGLYTLFHCDQKFEEDISRLQRMLNHQMEIYEAEQRTLMVMLECEQEETKERERAHSHKVQAEIDKRERKREQQLLFGKRIIEDDDPLYPFMKFYSQAEDYWEAFIQIRRDWDRYLVTENTPGASRIPNTWVMPPELSNTFWAKYLES